MNLDGFLLPGHVSSIIGSRPYAFLPGDFGLAGVISGFEPLDILQSILLMIRQVKDRRPRIEIQYRRGVLPEGNRHAVEVLEKVFQPVDAEWRGLGRIPQSGLAARRVEPQPPQSVVHQELDHVARGEELVADRQFP
ncbi:MAG: hydrogenase formation protein HypD, partial [Anaerolineales bacterium]|nr:hydrogenase formation protein HypD [Anaerolineales bacterium]